MALNTSARQLKQWLALPPADTAKLMQDTRWADGLRGIASLFVVASHLVLCFARSVIVPCCAPGAQTPYLWQRPPFRLISMGHSWVAVFLILLGFVNGLKPLKLARQQRADAALSSLAVSAFRRTFRLMLPATGATVLSWVLCQLGAYEAARHGDAFWMYRYTPKMSDSWWAAVGDLIGALKGTWEMQGVNQYDQPQWALVFLLQGSLMVFMGLLATVNLTATWRTVVLAVLAVWSLDLSYELRDPLVGATVFGGLLLAELALSSIPAALAPLSPFLSPPLVAVGLLCMSLPSDFTENAAWSAALHRWGAALFPTSAQVELHRTWGSLGAVLLILGLLLSPHARRALAARPLLWLGRISFPIYLLHGTVVRSLLAWLALQGTPQSVDTDEGPVLRYPQRGPVGLWMAIAVAMAVVLVASHYWTLRVEPWFGRLTERVESLMTGRAAEPKGKFVLPTRKE